VQYSLSHIQQVSKCELVRKQPGQRLSTYQSGQSRDSSEVYRGSTD
jgi:hypothetical protein